jgi:lysozyme family protein
MVLDFDAEKKFDEWYLKKIEFNRKVYESVGSKLNIPWYVICCIHAKECSLNLELGLHNGQRWDQVTTKIPRGRGPFNSFAESAIDSCIYEGMHLVKNWSVEYFLWSLEKYNGFGFQMRNMNTPYLWSGTNHYTKGLFIEKPFLKSWFDPDAKANDLGAAVLLKCMENHGLISVNFESDFTTIDSSLENVVAVVDVPEKKPDLPSVQESNVDNKKSFLSTFFTKLFSFFRK